MLANNKASLLVQIWGILCVNHVYQLDILRNKMGIPVSPCNIIMVLFLGLICDQQLVRLGNNLLGPRVSDMDY